MSASQRGLTAAAAAGVLLATTVLAARPAHAADDPRAWLDRMARAIDGLNYEGELVHVHGDDATVMRVVHRVEGGKVTEKITSEDADREIIRTDDEVTCIFPDQHTVLVEARDDSGSGDSPLRAHLPGAGGIDPALYHVSFAGVDRVAGRRTQGIWIRPKDGFRYGYRIWLDRETAMPLHTQLFDEDGRTLEQFRFTDIELPQSIPDSAVRPSVAIDSFAVRRSAPPGVGPQPGEAGNDWAAGELPPGFRLSVRQAKVSPDARAGLRHMVYSDGLATVSVFIEPAVAASEQAEGLSQIGAANAYTTTVDGHMITAVGDVPARTVELFARSARPPAPGR